MKLFLLVLAISAVDIVTTGRISSSNTVNESDSDQYPIPSHIKHERFNLDKIELKAIAEGSANQAHSAAAGQDAAAHQASHLASSTLAQIAKQAANAAKTALLGKHSLVLLLDKQKQAAQVNLDAELVQLKGSESVVEDATISLKQTVQQVTLLIDALNNSEKLAEHAIEAAQRAEGEYASQTQMVIDSEKELKEVEEEVKILRTEFNETRTAAEKALQSARLAHSNAEKISGHHSDSGAAQEDSSSNLDGKNEVDHEKF